MTNYRRCAQLAAVMLMAVGLVGGPARVAAAGGVLSPPSTVTADCSRDVSAELNTFFAAVADNTTVRLPRDGCYRIEREVRILGKSNFVLDGNGTTLRRTTLSPLELQYPNANAFLRLAGLTSSRVENLRIRGINLTSDVPYRAEFGSYLRAYEFEHGIAISGSTGVTVRGVDIDGVFGDGVMVTGWDKFSRRQTSGITVTKLRVGHNGRQGIALSRVDGALIDGVDITSRRTGVDLEPDTVDFVVQHVEIRNSVFHSALLAFASRGAGPVDHISIHDNVITRSGVPFVYVESSLGVTRKDWRVTRNIVKWTMNSTVPGMKFSNVHGVVVDRNTVPFEPKSQMSAVLLKAGTSGAEVTCNWFQGAGPTLIRTDGTVSSYVAAFNSTGASPPTCPAPTTSPTVQATPTAGATGGAAASLSSPRSNVAGTSTASQPRGAVAPSDRPASQPSAIPTRSPMTSRSASRLGRVPRSPGPSRATLDPTRRPVALTRAEPTAAGQQAGGWWGRHPIGALLLVAGVGLVPLARRLAVIR